jgi:hypothetical protein
MIAVGNFYNMCIVLTSDGEIMKSALPSLYLNVLCCRDNLTAVHMLFVASDWSGMKALYQLILPELHLVAQATH